MVKKFISFSKKHLLVLSLLLTLLTGIRKGTWSTGYIGGTGIGFPLLYWRKTTWTDVIGLYGGSNHQYTLVLSVISLVVDILFWFLVLLTSKFIFKKILR